MKIYSTENVFNAALDRIRYLFDEFTNIIVCFSGGKDSTVVFNLAMIVAKEKKRLPLKVLFIDQEAEWEAVIKYIKIIMYDKRVKPLWFQMPLKIFNATSHKQHWLYCWEDGKKWIREKDKISIKENHYNCDRFAPLFTKILEIDNKDIKTCYLAGVRTEESPNRYMGLTNLPTYKWITWGRVENKKLEHYCFHPIYDWSYTDVWKAIESNNWPYCKIYDYMYQYGVPVHKMRVSNIHHETAVHSLFYLQEIEPDNWNKIIERIDGINTAGQLGRREFFVKNLPPMFKDWKEYRDYLLENLIEPENKDVFRRQFIQMDRHLRKQIDDVDDELPKMYKTQIGIIMTNDYMGTKQGNYNSRPRKNRKGRLKNE